MTPHGQATEQKLAPLQTQLAECQQDTKDQILRYCCSLVCCCIMLYSSRLDSQELEHQLRVATESRNRLKKASFHREIQLKYTRIKQDLAVFCLSSACLALGPR